MPDLQDVAIVGLDLNGNLLDSSDSLASGTNTILAPLSRDKLATQQVLPCIGLGPTHTLEQALLASGGIPEGQFGKLFDRSLRDYEDNIAVKIRLFPGALDLQQSLKRARVKMGVVANKLEYLASKLLSKLAVLDVMEVVNGGDTLGPGNAKPSGKTITEMIRGCGGGRAVFVGGSIHDIAAAHNAGTLGILLLHDRSTSKMGGLGADYSFEDCRELCAA